MTLPRLELTERPNKNNDFIIFRYPLKSNKPQNKITTKKHILRKKNGTKKRKTKHGKTRKGFFNIF